MKIVITLKDEENGHVKIDCNPPIPKMVERYKSGELTPALIYAVLALKKMNEDSEQIAREKEKERQDSLLMNRLILPDPRDKIIKPTGPTDVN